MRKVPICYKVSLEGMSPTAGKTAEISTVTSEELIQEQFISITEENKMRLVYSRFLDINENDLMEGDEFFCWIRFR